MSCSGTRESEPSVLPVALQWSTGLQGFFIILLDSLKTNRFISDNQWIWATIVSIKSIAPEDFVVFGVSFWGNIPCNWNWKIPWKFHNRNTKITSRAIATPRNGQKAWLNLAFTGYLSVTSSFLLLDLTISFPNACISPFDYFRSSDHDILHRWESSIYKLLWRDVCFYLTVYTLLGLMYKYGLNKEQQT